MQDAGNIPAVMVQGGDETGALFRAQQRVGDDDVSLPDLPELMFDRPLLALRQAYEVQQSIGHTAARRQHDRQSGMRILFEDARDPLHARSVCDTRTTELVNSPMFHVAHLDIVIAFA